LTPRYLLFDRDAGRDVDGRARVDSRLAKIQARGATSARIAVRFFWLTPVVLSSCWITTGAINDTSPIAALSSAVTYGALTVRRGRPGTADQVRGLWPSCCDVDKLSAPACRSACRCGTSISSQRIDEIASNGRQYDKLLALARRLVVDLPALDNTARWPSTSNTRPTRHWRLEEDRNPDGAMNRFTFSKGLTDEVHDLCGREADQLVAYVRAPGDQVARVAERSVIVPVIIVAGPWPSCRRPTTATSTEWLKCDCRRSM